MAFVRAARAGVHVMNSEGAIVLFVEDPGAMNCIVPLAQELERRGLPTRLMCDGHAAALLDARGIAALRAPNCEEACAAMLAMGPRAVVVGTSENPRTCAHALVAAARAAHVPTIGVIDFAANAARRFSGAGEDPLAHAPDALLVPDDWTATEYRTLGFPAAAITVTGHPHCDVVLQARERLDAQGRARVRRRVLPAAALDRTVLVFVSEISAGLDEAQYRRSAAYTLTGRGDSDARSAIVFEELLLALDVLAREGLPRPYVVLRLHPKETSELDRYSGAVDLVSRGGDALEIVYAADVVVGMTSMLLLEAHLLGAVTLSVVPRALERAWLPTTRTGVTPCALTRAAVHQLLRDALARTARGAAAQLAPSRSDRNRAAAGMADAVLSRARRAPVPSD